MKVSELITLLSKLPGDRVVTMQGCDCEIGIKHIYRRDNWGDILLSENSLEEMPKHLADDGYETVWIEVSP